MGKIIEIPFSKNLIEFIAEELIKEERDDFSQILMIFPHHRPAIYLNQALSKKLVSSFFPPKIYSMDDFINFLIQKTPSSLAKRIANLDDIYLLFEIVTKIAEAPWKKTSSSFTQFLPWGLKLAQVIEELDIELVSDEMIKKADLGKHWDLKVAEKASLLMNYLGQIRKDYHASLKKHNLSTRGQDYALAASYIEEIEIGLFKKIYLAGIFAMSKAEKIIIQHLLKKPEVTFIRQNNGDSWTPFKEMDSWAEKVELKEEKDTSPEIFLYRAFNTHSEVMGLRDLLIKENPDSNEKTAIILPEPSTLIPLLSEVMTTISVDYNITMGYPAVRTPIYALLDLFIKLQESKREDTYYLWDYLSLLTHPYIKNLSYLVEPTQMRTLIHSIEEIFLEKKRPFIKLEEIEECSKLFEQVSQTTEGSISSVNFKDILLYLHNFLIRRMAKIKTIRELGNFFEEILIFLLTHSPAARYPFSGEFFSTFLEFLKNLKNSLIKDEEFNQLKDLFEIFRQVVKERFISFKGIPLKGLQILGLLETRCLNLNQVFILDTNEGLLPSVELCDSLLPFSLRSILGMPLYYDQEEIYRYHFQHLVSGAGKVYIFYRETEKDFRSRFIERLVWEEEKKQGKLKVLEATPVELNIFLRPLSKFKASKISPIISVLKEMSFSPTMLDLYLQCSAKFYFAKVLGLKEKENTLELDSIRIGNLLHKTLESLYQSLIGKGWIGKEQYLFLEEKLTLVLEEIFLENFGEIFGESYLLKELAFRHLKEYLRLEKEQLLGEHQIISTEKMLSCRLKLKNGRVINLKGKIDRIDLLTNEEYMIVDYKLGGNLERYTCKMFDQVLTNRNEIREKINSLQLPFYLFLYQKLYFIPYSKINAKLVSLQTKKEKILFDQEAGREKFIEEFFLPTVENLIGEILDEKILFVADGQEEACQSCSFFTLCQK
ncbi:PD-(D/E)XK nuclease family protein [bacterium]|nr:PD-(D/E)XK nuclease family protein [bacterium]MBU1153142.1 PD-(D/E)XK nuclease family protein [bacterium]